jgi:ABC-type uncharacterized transport system permease subunit
LGGAHLSLAYTQMCVDNMTAGQGWIALIIASGARARRRLGTPAALGRPDIRGT